MNAIAIFLTAFVFSLHLALPAATWLTHRRTIADDPMARLWYAGGLVQAVVVLMIGLRPVVPEWVGFHGAAVLAALSIGLIMEAIRRELGMRPLDVRQAALMLAVWAGAFSALYAVKADGTLGIAAMSLCLASLDVTVGLLSWRLYRRERRSSALLMMGAVMIAAIGHITRGIIAVGGRLPFDPRILEPWTAFIVTCWVLSFILLYVGGLSYLLDKAQSRLHASLLREQVADHQRERAVEEVRRRDELLIDNARIAAAAATSLYTSAIIHEMSQPLQTLRLALESAERQAHSDPLPDWLVRDLKEMQDVTADAAAILATLRGLLATGQIHSGPVDVAAALADVVKVIEAEARRRGIEFQQDLPPGPLPALCDRVMLQRIVFNLAANAFDELQQSGPPASMALRLGRVQEGGQAWVELSMMDSGRGMPEPVLQSLGEGWRSSKLSGMGLALRLARELMVRWHGRLEIAGTGGHPRPGTCVRLLLVPAAASALA